MTKNDLSDNVNLLLLLGLSLIAPIVISTASNRLSGPAITSGGLSPVMAFGQIALAMIGLTMFGFLFLQLQVQAMTGLLILLLPIFSGRGLTWLTFYEDGIGGVTALNLTSALLIVCLTALMIRDRTWLRSISVSPWAWPAALLLFSGLLTQVYHLGLIAGAGVTYVRVVQPIIFVILISYWARSKEGLRQLFGCLMAASLVAIIFKNPSIETFSERAAAIGSWTIYGTILVSVLVFAVGLWAATRKPAWKILLPGFIGLIFVEALATQTRGAIIALPLLALFVAAKSSRKTAMLAVAVLLGFVLASGWTLDLTLPGGRALSFDTERMMAEPNWLGRVERNTVAWEYIKSHPFTGLGLGRPTNESGPDIAYWVYNPYLHWGVAMGAPALLAFALIMLLSVFQSIKNFVRELPDLRIYPLAILISLLVWVVNQFTTGDSLTYLQQVESILFFYAVIGMIIGQWATREEHADISSLEGSGHRRA